MRNKPYAVVTKEEIRVFREFCPVTVFVVRRERYTACILIIWQPLGVFPPTAKRLPRLLWVGAGNKHEGKRYEEGFKHSCTG